MTIDVDSFLATATARLEALISWLFGSNVSVAAIGTLTVTDVVAIAIYLAFALILHLLVGALVRRRSRPNSSASALLTQHHVVAALGNPVSLVIWIYGIYFAATPILLKLPRETGGAALRNLLDIVFDLGALAALFVFFFRATRVVESRMAAWAVHTPSKVDDLLVPLLGSSLRVIIIAVGVIAGLPLLRLPLNFAALLEKLTSILLIGSVAVLCMRAVSITERVILTRYDISAADNLRARKVYTQIHVVSRMLYVIIGFLGVAAILMLFQEVRHVGASLLASAGIAGIIAGFAAQKTLANLFAGFQIALTQPVRQDDVVVVEGEWGRVEEITLSYVVVRIWDERRLILPLTYFIEKPFQNWTRNSADIMGSVMIWVDYTYPVDQARSALQTIIENSPLWDRRFWNLQVSDSSATAMQLRILVTSEDSSKSWDLRCEIREKFIAHIQTHNPSALPFARAQLIV